jgi:predicted dehydrogenase
MASGENEQNKSVDRRDFMKTGAALGTVALVSQMPTPGAHAAGTDKLRIGLIGCGGRGTRDAANCLNAAPGVELHAMGDLFERGRGRRRRQGVEESYAALKSHGDKVNAPNSRRFVGWDAYKRVLETDVDLVLLTTPPHFRPMQYRAAIEAGKHVFMEKPVAVDPVGARSVIETSTLAEEKNLGVLAGTQMRHRADYIEAMQRIHDGQIGEVLAAQAYYNTGELWTAERFDDQSDIEWQIRNWLYFTWLSGDFICEQDVHKIDILNWGLGGPPQRALGMGGRQRRTGEEHGNIYDHFTVQFDYGNGVNALNMCRQMNGTAHRGGEYFVGTKGRAVPTGFYGLKIMGDKPWQHQGGIPNPSVQEFRDLIQSLRKGEPINEGKRVAESSLTAIMGRMSAYTGRALSWQWLLNESSLSLGPDDYAFSAFKPAPVAVPGQTPLK